MICSAVGYTSLTTFMALLVGGVSCPSRRTRPPPGRARRADGRSRSALRSATARRAAPSRRRARRAARRSSSTFSGCSADEIVAARSDRSARSKEPGARRALRDLQLPAAGEHAAVVARAPEERRRAAGRALCRARRAAGRRRRSRDRSAAAPGGGRGGGEDVDVGDRRVEARAAGQRAPASGRRTACGCRPRRTSSSSRGRAG